MNPEHPAPPRHTAVITAARRPPPSHRNILSLAGMANDLAWFENVASYSLTGEQCQEIRTEPVLRQKLEKFIGYFEQEYFPLSPNFTDFYIPEYYSYEDKGGIDMTPIKFMQEGIPVATFGMPKELIHEIHQHLETSALLPLLLTREDEIGCESDSGLRVVWMEHAQDEGISEDLLKSLPEGGIPVKQIRECLEDTPFKNLIHVMNWNTSSSGNIMFDVGSPEEEFGTGFQDEWNRENILLIKEVWSEAKTMLDAQQKFLSWLSEGNLEENFRQTLEYLKWRMKTIHERGDVR